MGATKENPRQANRGQGRGGQTSNELPHCSTFTFDRQEIKSQIRDIALAALIQSHGVTLKKSGSRYVAICPFHDEKTGSFFVYPNNTFYCFGCGVHGDAATFIMKSCGCSFPEALERLGLKESNNRYSKIEIQKFQKNKEKRLLVEAFRRWESRYSSKLGGLITSGHTRLSKIKTDDDLTRAAWIYPFLSQWKYHLDILCYGSDRDKYNLFREVS